MFRPAFRCCKHPKAGRNTQQQLIPQWDPRHRTGVNPLAVLGPAVLLLENRLKESCISQAGFDPPVAGDQLIFRALLFFLIIIQKIPKFILIGGLRQKIRKREAPKQQTTQMSTLVFFVPSHLQHGGAEVEEPKQTIIPSPFKVIKFRYMIS